MGFNVGKILKNVGKAVGKAVKDTGKQVVRSGQDVAAVADTKLFKLAAAGVLTATGVGAPAAAAILATSGAAAGLAKRGGNIGKAATGAATGAAAAVVAAGAKKIITTVANKGGGGFRNTILNKAKDTTQERVATALEPSRKDAGMPVLLAEPEPTPAFKQALDRTEADIQRRGRSRYGRSWQDTVAQRDAVMAEARNEMGGDAMLNANRDKQMETAGDTPVDLPAMTVTADAPSTEPATMLPAWKKWLPLIVVAIIIIVVMMSRKKG